MSLYIDTQNQTYVFKKMYLLENWHSGTVFYSSLRVNGDQKLDVYDQKKQNFIEHFSQIVKLLTEGDMRHPDTGDLLPCSRRSWSTVSLEGSANGE